MFGPILCFTIDLHVVICNQNFRSK